MSTLKKSARPILIVIVMNLTLFTVTGISCVSSECKSGNSSASAVTKSTPPAPKYIQNWRQIRIGLSKSQVVDLLGEPSDHNDLMTPPMKSGIWGILELPGDYIGIVASAIIFDMAYENWDYGDFRPFDNFLCPSDSAYVVGFDMSGHVARFREPITPDGRVSR